MSFFFGPFFFFFFSSFFCEGELAGRGERRGGRGERKLTVKTCRIAGELQTKQPVDKTEYGA